MRPFRRATPSDYRQLDRLVWNRGGVHDEVRAQGWKVSKVVFSYRNKIQFRALGHRWTISLCVGVLRKALEATVYLTPEQPLSLDESLRLEALGFYDDMKALFCRMGFPQTWFGIPGEFTRYFRQLSEIAGIQRCFDDLSLGAIHPSRLSQTPRQARGYRLLEWGRGRSGWSITHLALEIPVREHAAGHSWRTRRDVILGLVNSCSWLYVWPSPRFTSRHWKSVEKSGFFKRTTDELNRLGQKGYWRADLFSDPDRMAAEFWKPERRGPPEVSWKDFQALLNWRLEHS